MLRFGHLGRHRIGKERRRPFDPAGLQIRSVWQARWLSHGLRHLDRLGGAAGRREHRRRGYRWYRCQRCRFRRHGDEAFEQALDLGMQPIAGKFAPKASDLVRHRVGAQPRQPLFVAAAGECRIVPLKCRLRARLRCLGGLGFRRLGLRRYCIADGRRGFFDPARLCRRNCGFRPARGLPRSHRRRSCDGFYLLRGHAAFEDFLEILQIAPRWIRQDGERRARLPPMAYTSLSALAAAMAPSLKGSSTTE